MNDNQIDDSKAAIVTRTIVNSVSKMVEKKHVPAEEALEGLLKAVGVYALQQLGTPGAVAEVFENFAETIRQIPIESTKLQ
ncbi:MAG: hypothetical protein K0R85_392 [Devosia sp.]|jgi:hypothetical protein|nr:hypothetical protein [Devosia sp.]